MVTFENGVIVWQAGVLLEPLSVAAAASVSAGVLLWLVFRVWRWVLLAAREERDYWSGAQYDKDAEKDDNHPKWHKK